MSIPDGVQVRIRVVWGANLCTEFQHINSLKHAYPYISMDTEFPGSVFVMDPQTDALCDAEQKYQILKANVDNLKLIQVGFTLTNEHGALPVIDGDYSVWEFNFCDFNPIEDLYVKDSIDLLRSSGIDLERNHREGIESQRFGCLLKSSGLVRNYEIQYITYAGDFDYAYLLKVITGDVLPPTRVEFEQKVHQYFGATCDVQDVQHRYFKAAGGLQRFSELLGVRRLCGLAHQAGSDSLLTASAYHTMVTKIYSSLGGLNNSHGLPSLDTVNGVTSTRSFLD